MPRGIYATPVQTQEFARLRSQGWSRAAACREVGLSQSWGVNYERRHTKTSEGYRAFRESVAVGITDPKNPEELCAEAKRGLEDFEFFRRFYLGHVSTPWQVQTGERLVELLATPHKEFVVENCPPGVGKTTLVHDFACWITAQNRGVRGLIGSRKANNGARMVRRIRRSLERTVPLKAPTEDVDLGLGCDAGASLAAHFGAFKPSAGNDVWRGDEFVVAQLDDVPIEEKEPTWSSYGVDSGVLGNRFDVIFWDDLVDRTNTRSTDTRQGLEELWDSELETRLEPGGLLVLLGQRLTAGDLYAFCREKVVEADPDDEESTGEGEAMYHRIVYQAHDEERCEGVHRMGEAVPWPDGCLLDPYRLPWRDLRKIKSTNRTAFEVSYQQKDVDPDGVLVNPLWVKGGRGADGVDYPGCWDKERTFLDRPAVGDNPLSVITVDPSPTKWWSVQWWVTASDGTDLSSRLRYLMDLARQKMTAPDALYAEPGPTGRYIYTGLLERWRLHALSMNLGVSHVIIEENAAQRFFTQQPYFRQWCSENRIAFLPHQTHRNKNSPEYGVGSLGPLWKFGLIRLPGKTGDPGRVNALKLVDEVQKWPGGSTDDCVMAHWFHEVALPNITRIDASRVPRLHRPSWMLPDMARDRFQNMRVGV